MVVLGATGVWHANATTNLVFSETMATTAAKPWSGAGYDNHSLIIRKMSPPSARQNMVPKGNIWNG